MSASRKSSFVLLVLAGILIVFSIVLFLHYRNTPSVTDVASRVSPQPTINALKNDLGLTTYASNDYLTVCSFNIKFLGHYKYRNNTQLALILKSFDIVFIQELVVPPVDGNYPDGTRFQADSEAAQFLSAMQNNGYSYWLSEEDTASGDNIHESGSPTASEWWIAFYKPHRVNPAKDLPNGFIADDRSNNPDYERVPYAFSFRTADNNLDFVAISVHLKPSSGRVARARRAHELNSITSWIDRHKQSEKDFLIVGDMNLESSDELLSILPHGYTSLNRDCVPTNVNPNSPKPYDHVLFRPAEFTKLYQQNNFLVINLVEAMASSWHSVEPYPGAPFVQGPFERFASDHHPIVFHINNGDVDDDWDDATIYQTVNPYVWRLLQAFASERFALHVIKVVTDSISCHQPHEMDVRGSEIKVELSF